jgi:hypothetical protein
MGESQEFSADDLAMVGDAGGAAVDGQAGGAAETKPAAKADVPAEGKPTGGKATIAAEGEAGAKPKDEGKGKAPIAAGGEDAQEGDDEEKAKPEDKADGKLTKAEQTQKWREEMAEHVAAGDKKAYARELKRLERITDPKAVWGMYRELESKFTSGGLIKVPGKDAKPEEIAEFHKALGVPEKPEDYFKDVKLENGAVIGEADKPLVDGFAAAVHKSGATPQFVNAALNWYYANQEEQAAAMDEADDEFRRESERALKDEFGASFKRKTNAIAVLFASAPGGTDVKNEGSLYARLMGGRTADGKIIGNDPDMVRLLVNLASEVSPTATVVEDGMGVKGAQARLAEIQKLRSTDKHAYWSDPIQKEEADLIAALEKEKLRARA